MAKQPESRLQRRIRDRLEKKFGGKWRKIHGGPFQAAGILDLIGCVKGLYFEIEVKTKKGKPSELQLDTIKELKLEGACTGIVRTVEEAEALVAEHLRKNDYPVVTTSTPSEKGRRVRSRSKDRRTVLQTASRKNVDITRSNRKTRPRLLVTRRSSHK